MLLRAAMIAVLLALLSHHIHGFQKIIVVNEVLVDDDPVTDENATRTVGNCSGSGYLSNLCCVYGNCCCPSLYTALVSLTNNSLINITSDVTLSQLLH